MNDLISIVVPIYNAEEYLKDTLKSVEVQTYSNYELLLIDDGSTDRSRTICEEYISVNKKARYFYKKNSGVSDTRNFGIKNAKGKYICFLDSDDIWEESFLSDMIGALNSTKCDISCCKFKKFKKKVKRDNKHTNTPRIIEGNYKYDYLFSDSMGYVTNKVYILDIIRKNNLLFRKDIHMSEDLLFVFEYFKVINKIVYLDSEDYNYRVIASSSSKNLKNIRWFSIYKVWDELRASINNSNLKDTMDYLYQMYLLEGKYRANFINDKNEKNKILTAIGERQYRLKLNKSRYTKYQNIKLFLYSKCNYIAYSLKFFIKR